MKDENTQINTHQLESSLSSLSSLSSMSTTVQPLKVKRALKWQKSKSMTCDCLVNSLELVLGHLQV